MNSSARWAVALEANRIGSDIHIRLLLDSRVVDVPMAFNPTFVMLSFFNTVDSFG
jgi:hypothetical protein